MGRKIANRDSHKIAVEVSTELYWKIKAASALEQMPVSDWMAFILSEYLKFRPKKK